MLLRLQHAARAARGRASAFQWEGGAPSAAAASVNSSGVASSWFRAEGADETLPFYLAHGRRLREREQDQLYENRTRLNINIQQTMELYPVMRMNTHTHTY